MALNDRLARGYPQDKSDCYAALEFCFHRRLRALRAAGGGGALEQLRPSLRGRERQAAELVLPYCGPEAGWPERFEPKRMSALDGPGTPGRLSALSIFLCKSVLYGGFVWACRTLKH